MKKSVFLSFTIALVVFIIPDSIYGQVGIGTMNPEKSAALDVSWDSLATVKNPLGTLIPRMTEAERDNIQNPANGLLIYNTDEGCINSFDAQTGEWNSLCGGVAKAVFTAGCDGLAVFGTYVQGTALNSSNYLTLNVNVTKAGAYTISVTTDNGYGFNGGGTFLNTGAQQVTLMGQGKPANTNETPGDVVTMILNGYDALCNQVNIAVLPPVATYTMSCSNSTVNGVYQIGVPLNNTNTITVPVTVTDISSGGSWSITTNTVEGISFSGYGTFISIGPQTVTLQGTGTPASTIPAEFTLTSNSGGGVETSCSGVTVMMAITSKIVYTLGIGVYDLSHNTTAPYRMLTAASNYGTNSNSKVKYVQPITFVDGGMENTPANIRSVLLGSTPPDIVITGYNWEPSVSNGPQIAQIFLDYLSKGGVVLMFCESNDIDQVIMRVIFGDMTINSGTAGPSNSRYLYPFLTDDPILNGPFGNITGKFWGEDASATIGLPSSLANNPNITVYTTSPTTKMITSFRHNKLSLVWVGDGGFNSHPDGINAANSNDTNAYPFWIDANNYPIEKPSYGQSNTVNTINGFPGPVQNSIFTANAFAWAIQMAQTKGINNPH